MKIVVLNGSPKGPVSVTMQYVSYIAKRHPEHELKAWRRIPNVSGQLSKRSAVPMACCGPFPSTSCWSAPSTSASSS